MIRGRDRSLAAIAIVSGTFTAVLSFTILNVPIDDIAHDLHVSLSAASLAITPAWIAFATFLPLGGWLGDRFCRRNVYCLAVGALGLAGLVAMVAHDLATLVAMRVLQGLASAAIVPVVMKLIKDLYEPERRAFALGAWATANSFGQALGPPLGGVLASAVSWRATFGLTSAIALFTCAAAWRYVPQDAKRAARLEWRGALGLTLGALLLQVAFAAISQLGPGSPVVAVLAGLGLLSLGDFARTIRTAAHPFVSPRAFREPSFVTSCIGVFAATITFGAALLAIPLYLITLRHLTTQAAGFVVFALPLAMALCAPLTNVIVKRLGSLQALRAALIVLLAGSTALGLVIARTLSLAGLETSLLVVGAAVALIYTTTAVGATATEAGNYGAAIGLYNLMRIGGSSIGTALVAIVLSKSAWGFAAIFVPCSGALMAALAMTFIFRHTERIAR